MNGAVVSSAQITVLVVDDERLARERLRVLLEGEPDLGIVGECASGLDALAAITRHRPELVFLDVQMPDLDGLGVIAALDGDETPEIIFVTAHDSYMERAFELHAVDYLRKPYTNERFATAMTHARRRVQARRRELADRQTQEEEAGTIKSRFSPVLNALRTVHSDPRLALQDRTTGTWHLIDKDKIDWIQADGSARVRVHLGSSSHLWKRTLAELERTLDPGVFLRVHRSYIVNCDRIQHVKPLLKGEYSLILTNGTLLDTGRTYRDVVERFLNARS